MNSLIPRCFMHKGCVSECPTRLLLVSRNRKTNAHQLKTRQRAFKQCLSMGNTRFQSAVLSASEMHRYDRHGFGLNKICDADNPDIYSPLRRFEKSMSLKKNRKLAKEDLKHHCIQWAI